jgi:NAD(P)-dependent dehydrogenase (short-subunit alcohol dehydrogenase family)
MVSAIGGAKHITVDQAGGATNVPSMKPLEGKVAIVTGAGRGIGRAIAVGFADSGAKLSLMARTRKELEETADELRKRGASVRFMAGDVSEQKTVKKLVEGTIKQFGRIDVLVNNAGLLGPIGPLEENDAEQWERAMKVNLFGYFLCCKYVLPHMKSQKAGKIINMSGAGAPNPYPMFTAYSSSKTGVLGLTQTLSAELKGFNIQVNAIAPGITNTRMQDEIISAGAKAGEAFQRAKDTKSKGGVPPERAADLCVFLASSESDGITGRFFSARWDPWQSLKEKAELQRLLSSEMFTVKRIDGVFFEQKESKKQ